MKLKFNREGIKSLLVASLMSIHGGAMVVMLTPIGWKAMLGLAPAVLIKILACGVEMKEEER